MQISTREAQASDAAFIAWVQLAAGRGHCERGFFDLAFTATGSELLDDVEALVVAPARSFHHWSRFLIAEVDELGRLFDALFLLLLKWREDLHSLG